MEEVKKQGMESLFCPYELALELKELGFDEISLFCYDTVNEGNPLSHCPHLFLNSQLEGFENEPISAPLYQQAFRWFREKYKLHSCIVLPINKIDYAYEIKNISENIRQDFLSEMQSGIIYSSYEKAELACIRKLIEIAKEQNVK